MSLHDTLIEEYGWDGRINARGLDIIKHFEGLVDGDSNTPGLEPYRDPIGIPTLGYGSIWGMDGARVAMDHRPISEAEAEFLLDREARHTENAVAKLIHASLTPNQFSALVSFTYNVGSGNLQASTLRQKINRGDYAGAADELPKWRRAGGRILRGLVLRREAERLLFLA